MRARNRKDTKEQSDSECSKSKINMDSKSNGKMMRYKRF